MPSGLLTWRLFFIQFINKYLDTYDEISIFESGIYLYLDLLR